MSAYEEWAKNHQPFSKEFLLEEKLSKWFGREPYCKYPTGYEWENYTESLDACVEDLIPKLKSIGYMARVQYSPLRDNDTGKLICDWTGYASCYDVSGKRGLNHFEEWAIAPTMALALCLAIEKVIDNFKETK